MPIDPVTGSLIVAGLAGASQGVNAISQGNMNKKTRRWNEDMYERQKADNQNQWHMQNEYNSPQNQMARLREAGLNPNLVYGNGADVQASPIPANSSPGSWNPKAPEIDLASMAKGGLGTYADVQLKQAQIDNVKMATTVAAQDAILKGAQTAQTQLDTKKGESTFDYFVDATKANLQKLQTDVHYQSSEKQSSLNLQMEQQLNVLADTANKKAQLQSILKDNQLKDLDIWLRQQGINPNDPMIMRIIGQGAKQIMDGTPIGTWINHFKSKLSGK